MKRTIFFFLYLLLPFIAFSQKPSKEQIEKDKKEYAEAQKKLNEKLSKMDPKAKKTLDSMMNAFGVGTKMQEANEQINNNSSALGKKATVSLSRDKDNKGKVSIAATPSTAGIGSFIGTKSNTVFAAVLPAAKNKASEIYKALKNTGAGTAQLGNAATALWMSGHTQIALCVMAQVCINDAGNTDHLNNYASMLTMMGAPEMAIPILNNLNARFKKNTTILNNLGQAWFAVGETDKATKYLDSTLLLNASHAQANETKCLIAESKGNKTAALAHAKAAFKQGATQQRKDKLAKLGYFPTAADYGNFPPLNKSDDLLNLGGFLPMEFPKSYASMKMYEQQRKIFLAEIDKQSKPLQKIAETANKTMLKQLEEQQKRFMDAKQKAINNPGSISMQTATAIVRAPMFSEKVAVKQKLVIENLMRKKNEVLKKMADFRNNEGAAYKKEYDATMKKISERWKNVGEMGSENNQTLCMESVKAVDTYLAAFNTRYEELYQQYLVVQKQFLNEMSYQSLYTTYPEAMPSINAGLKLQWLNDLSFKAEVIGVSYGCNDEGKIKEGRLTQFKDPNCNINSEFGQTLGVANLGFSIKVNCIGISTSFNALTVGVTLNQDLDHAGFGDSFKNCTVSIGPKASVGGKVGPLEASANVGGGVDIEMDRTGITDIVVKAGAEIEAGLHNPSIKDTGVLGTAAAGSAGVEGKISLISGVSSIQGTGIFNK